MDDDDRRTGPPTRRDADLVNWRLDQLEAHTAAQVARDDALDARIAAIEKAVSPEVLDHRFVPRAEHARRQRDGRDWALRLGMLVLGVGQIVTAILAARGR